jgi:hypothetical protein
MPLTKHNAVAANDDIEMADALNGRESNEHEDNAENDMLLTAPILLSKQVMKVGHPTLRSKVSTTTTPSGLSRDMAAPQTHTQLARISHLSGGKSVRRKGLTNGYSMAATSNGEVTHLFSRIRVAKHEH